MIQEVHHIMGTGNSQDKTVRRDVSYRHIVYNINVRITESIAMLPCGSPLAYPAGLKPRGTKKATGEGAAMHPGAPAVRFFV